MESIKNLLKSKSVEFIMEAHNGLSAMIVEKVGFKGIWASSFSISAACGARDCNEISWTQSLDIINFMTDAVNIPILMDADTGFGNYNNVRRLVRQAERIGLSGICIEDKIFPKRNSFDKSSEQTLSTVSEFIGKIKAGKDTQSNESFCVIARTEAYIAGFNTEHALERAVSYAQAGADAIVVHSKKETPDEIIEFMNYWDIDVPIVIIPTSYYKTPIRKFEELGISMVIWANHNIRASYNHMYKISKELFDYKSIERVVSDVASMQQIFNITHMQELQEADRKYL
jgi:phosphoenolpyruvate phosphomutase